MKNKISDLNNHLFDQLERLNDNNLTADQLELEIKRATAINGIAVNVVATAKVTLDAFRLIKEGECRVNELPSIFSETKLIEAAK